MSQMSTHQRGSKLTKMQKMASINAQMRLLLPKKVSDDDQLVEYDSILLDRFLNVLQDLHGSDVKETVHTFITVATIVIFYHLVDR